MKIVLGLSGSHKLDQCAEGLCRRLGFPDVSDVCECAVREGVGLLEDGLVQGKGALECLYVAFMKLCRRRGPVGCRVCSESGIMFVLWHRLKIPLFIF